MQLGIFGGSFDPVHWGHLVLAKSCLQQAVLDQVWFVPTAHQPFKPQGPQASECHRLAMLQLACQSESRFIVSEIEFSRGGGSYTGDTLAAIREDLPAARLFFLMGADALVDFPNWYQPAEICRLATPLVVHRAGSMQPDFQHIKKFMSRQQLAIMHQLQVEMPATPISSSQIRKLISEDGDWRLLVPPAVAEYIEQQDLYRAC